MNHQGPIWECAERDLVFTDESGNQELFLWEHSQRVAQNVRLIAKLPDVPAHDVDNAALEVAALYHDAGWVLQLRRGTLRRCELLCRPTSDQQRDLAARHLSEALAGLLKPRSLDFAASVVRQLSDRNEQSVEAQILADADNLDEIGSLSLWSMFRRNSFEGKGIEAILRTWERQKEFRFWEARVSKSIRFEPVKRIAFRRLEEHDRMMGVLARHHAGADVAALLDRPAERKS